MKAHPVRKHVVVALAVSGSISLLLQLRGHESAGPQLPTHAAPVALQAASAKIAKKPSVPRPRLAEADRAQRPADIPKEGYDLYLQSREISVDLDLQDPMRRASPWVSEQVRTARAEQSQAGTLKLARTILNTSSGATWVDKQIALSMIAELSDSALKEEARTIAKEQLLEGIDALASVGKNVGSPIDARSYVSATVRAVMATFPDPAAAQSYIASLADDKKSPELLTIAEIETAMLSNK